MVAVRQRTFHRVDQIFRDERPRGSRETNRPNQVRGPKEAMTYVPAACNSDRCIPSDGRGPYPPTIS